MPRDDLAPATTTVTATADTVDSASGVIILGTSNSSTGYAREFPPSTQPQAALLFLTNLGFVLFAGLRADFLAFGQDLWVAVFRLQNKLLDKPVFGILEKPRVGRRDRLPTPAETQVILAEASPAFRLITRPCAKVAPDQANSAGPRSLV